MRDIFKDIELTSAAMQADHKDENRRVVSCAFSAPSSAAATRLLIYLLSMQDNVTDGPTEEVLADNPGFSKPTHVVSQQVVLSERASAEPTPPPAAAAQPEQQKRTRAKKEQAAVEAPPVNTPTPEATPDFSQAVSQPTQAAPATAVEPTQPAATVAPINPPVQATSVTVVEQPAHQREIDELRAMAKQLMAANLPFDFALMSIQQHAEKTWKALSTQVVENWVRTVYGVPAAAGAAAQSVIDSFGGSTTPEPKQPVETHSVTMAAAVQASISAGAAPSAGLVEKLHELLLKLSASGSVTVPTFGSATADFAKAGVTAEQIVEALRSRPDLFSPFGSVADPAQLTMLGGVLPVFWK